MGWYSPTSRQRAYQLFPKVELHRHLEGSLRFETLLEVARDHGITIPMTPGLHALISVQPNDPLNFTNFLSKFQILRIFYRSREVIERVTREAVEDAASDNIYYLELRFTPVALTRAQDFSLQDVIDWVVGAAKQAGRDTGVMVRLIASVNRHESPALAGTVAGLAAERIQDGIVGLDLAGNEADFAAAPFAPVFAEAHRKGLFLSVHAGEWGGAANVAEALDVLEADRIAHGVRVMEDQAVVEKALSRGTPFEVCLTSNFQSGVVPSLAEHPVRKMIDAGLYVTLNTDDPSISRITLSDEYRLAVDMFGMNGAELARRVLLAANAAFLPPGERDALVVRLAARLADTKLTPV